MKSLLSVTPTGHSSSVSSEYLSTPHGRARLAAEIHAEVSAKVIARQKSLKRSHSSRLKYFLAVEQTVLTLNEAILAIRRRRLEQWTLPILSWLSLHYIEWNDEAERQKLTAKALSDGGALWWERPFGVRPFTLLPISSWNDFVTLPLNGSGMAMPIGPFVGHAGFFGRSVELWALSCAPNEVGALAPPGTWPFKLCVRLHALPRQRGGSSRGALPNGGLDILLADARKNDDFNERIAQHAYFIDFEQGIASISRGIKPDRVIDVAEESIPIGSLPSTISILLGTYLDRAGFLSEGTKRERRLVRDVVESQLLRASTSWLEDPGVSFGPDQAAKLREELLARFRHPRNPNSLREYIRRAWLHIRPDHRKQALAEHGYSSFSQLDDLNHNAALHDAKALAAANANFGRPRRVPRYE